MDQPKRAKRTYLRKVRHNVFGTKLNVFQEARQCLQVRQVSDDAIACHDNVLPYSLKSLNNPQVISPELDFGIKESLAWINHQIPELATILAS